MMSTTERYHNDDDNLQRWRDHQGLTLMLHTYRYLRNAGASRWYALKVALLGRW